MLNFMYEGGIMMWFILMLGTAALAYAVSFVIYPAEKKLDVIRPLSLSTLFASLTGFFMGFGMVMRHFKPVAQWAKDSELPLVVMIGLGESVCNLILGFGFLTIVWLLTAVGLRRQTN